LLRDGAVVDDFVFDLEVVVIPEVPQEGPADVQLHLLNQNPVEVDKGLEVEPLLSDCFIKLAPTLVDQDVFKRGDVLLLDIRLENVLLELCQLVVVQVAIEVLVADAEDAEHRSLVLRLNFLLQTVEKRLDWEENSSLGANDDVDQFHEPLSRALDAHLHLLEVHEERGQNRLQLSIRVRRP
jgi:hypothetical protein